MNGIESAQIGASWTAERKIPEPGSREALVIESIRASVARGSENDVTVIVRGFSQRVATCAEAGAAAQTPISASARIGRTARTLFR
jgi:hypothetical protein